MCLRKACVIKNRQIFFSLNSKKFRRNVQNFLCPTRNILISKCILWIFLEIFKLITYKRKYFKAIILNYV